MASSATGGVRQESIWKWHECRLNSGNNRRCFGNKLPDRPGAVNDLAFVSGFLD